MKANNDQIKRYILNELNEEEKINFQFQLLHNKPLQEELAMMRHLQKSLATQHLKPKQTQHKGKWWIASLVILLVGSLIFWFLNPNRAATSAEIKAPTIEHIKPSPPLINVTKNDKQSTVPPSKKINTEEETPKKSVAPTPTTPSPKVKDKIVIPAKKPSPPPIAAAFKVNPDLEGLINSHLRGDSFEFVITTPTQNAIFKTAEQAFNLTIKGQVIAEDSVEDDAFRCLIFSNKVADYKAFKSLADTPLTFTKIDNKINFEITQTIQLAAGLYYYLIEDENSGVQYSVGKFQVRTN